MPPSTDATWQRFTDIWVYCMTVHPGPPPDGGNMETGPCIDCVGRYAKDGPPPPPKPVPQVTFRAP